MITVISDEVPGRSSGVEGSSPGPFLEQFDLVFDVHKDFLQLPSLGLTDAVLVGSLVDFLLDQLQVSDRGLNLGFL